MEAGALDRDVDLLLGGLDGQRRPQGLRIGTGDLQLEAGDGIVREPLDPVDVRAVRGDATGDAGHRGGGQRAAEHGHVQPAAALRSALHPAGGQLDLHVQVRGDPLGRRPDPPDVGAGVVRHQHAEHQPPADHDLLDVGDDEREPGERAEQPRGHPGAIAAGQRDEQRAL